MKWVALPVTQRKQFAVFGQAALAYVDSAVEKPK